MRIKNRQQYKRAIAEHFNARTDYSRSSLMRGSPTDLSGSQPHTVTNGVLDIATGTGFVAIQAAQLVGKRGRVVDVDFSAGMLGQAVEAIVAAGVGNVDFIQADAGNFDLIFCCNALPYMTDVPAALRLWHSLLRPGGRLAFNCWAEHSYATGHLLRAIAARHGIVVALVGQDTGTRERCRAVLAAAGFVRPEVVAEPTATFFSADQLEEIPEMAVKNPLYGITPSDASRLSDLRDEYITEARSLCVRESIDAEAGAYFVLAHRPLRRCAEYSPTPICRHEEP